MLATDLSDFLQHQGEHPEIQGNLRPRWSLGRWPEVHQQDIGEQEEECKVHDHVPQEHGHRSTPELPPPCEQEGSLWAEVSWSSWYLCQFLQSVWTQRRAPWCEEVPNHSVPWEPASVYHVSSSWPVHSSTPYSLSIFPRILHSSTPPPTPTFFIILSTPLSFLVSIFPDPSFQAHSIFPSFLLPSFLTPPVLPGPLYPFHHLYHLLLATVAAQEALFHIQAVWLLQLFQAHPLWDILTATQGRTSQEGSTESTKKGAWLT